MNSIDAIKIELNKRMDAALFAVGNEEKREALENAYNYIREIADRIKGGGGDANAINACLEAAMKEGGERYAVEKGIDPTLLRLVRVELKMNEASGAAHHALTKLQEGGVKCLD